MKKTLKPATLIAAILAGGFAMTGCVAAAVGGAYVAGEELAEDDGDFDPLDEIGEDKDD